MAFTKSLFLVTILLFSFGLTVQVSSRREASTLGGTGSKIPLASSSGFRYRDSEPHLRDLIIAALASRLSSSTTSAVKTPSSTVPRSLSSAASASSHSISILSTTSSSIINSASTASSSTVTSSTATSSTASSSKASSSTASSSTASSSKASSSIASSSTASSSKASSSTASSFTATSSSTSFSTSSSSTTSLHVPTGITRSETTRTFTIVVTTTLCCHTTTSAFIGAIIFGGSDGGGVADVDGTFLTIEQGDTDEIVTPTEGGPPELSSISQTSALSTLKTSTTLSITTSTTTTTTTTTTTSNRSYSISSTTSSSMSTASTFLFVPQEGVPASQELTFQQNLQKLSVGPIDTVLGIGNNIAFWLANLTTQNANVIGADPVISHYYPDEVADVEMYDQGGEVEIPQDNGNRKNKRTDPPPGFTTQSRCPRGLQMISQPPAYPLIPLPSDPNADKDDKGIYQYDYVSTAGAGVTVYMVDSGATPEQREFYNMKGTVEWWFMTPNSIEDDQQNHGGCTLAKVAGETLGVAKNANIVVVKMTRALEFESYAITLKAFKRILSDVVTKNLQGKAVINYSRSMWLSPDDVGARFFIDWYAVLSDLIAQDVVIVASSGNDRTSRSPDFGNGRPSQDVDCFPCLFTKQNFWPAPFTPLPIVVVGAVDGNGARTQYSQGFDELTVSAHGNLWCPKGKPRPDGRQPKQWRMGTSHAAAQVSGQIAVILSNLNYYGLVYEPGAGKTSEKIIALIQDSSYSRTTGGPKVLYNDVNLDTCRNRNPDGVPVLAAAAACTISKPSTISSLLPTTTVSESVTWVTVSRTANDPEPTPTDSFPIGTQLNSSNISVSPAAGDGTWIPCLFSNTDMSGVTVALSSDSGWFYTIYFDCYDGYYSIHFLSGTGEDDLSLPYVDGVRNLQLGPYPQPNITSFYITGTKG